MPLINEHLKTKREQFVHLHTVDLIMWTRSTTKDRNSLIKDPGNSHLAKILKMLFPLS
jgi:hypothetical protein